jgi:HAD superfamily hydrolase (TIGR01509 family)
VPVRALSFDLFDTLVDMHMDRLPIVEIAGRRVPSTYGILHAVSLQWHALDFERFAAELGQHDRELRGEYYAKQRELPTLLRFRTFAERIGVSDDALAHALTETHMGEVARQVIYLAHHAPLLERLHGRAKLAVCSNFSHTATARAVLERAGLLRHFDAVVISEDVGLRKPHAEIFAAVAEQLAVPPAEIVHIGDDLAADVAGAAAVGQRTVWLTRRVADPAAALNGYDGVRPDHSIADLADLEALL